MKTIIKSILLMLILGTVTFAQFGELNIPARSADAPGGAEFMNSVKQLSFADREAAILEQFLAGNIPDFMRTLVEITSTLKDANGNSHIVYYAVMPDYLCIGSNSDYCRVPMGPITAQKIADQYGATMPTRKLVDDIWTNAPIHLQPVTYTPVGNNNEQVYKFIEHNTAIQAQFADAGGVEGQLVAGTKKDVVISNKIVDPARPNHVTIYGWHYTNGHAIQPLTNIHYDYYVDYSHGIRLLDNDIIIDGDTLTVQEVLKDYNLHKTINDESTPIYYPTYLYDENIPSKPKSFGVKPNGRGAIQVLIAPDTSVEKYHVFISEDGVEFGDPYTFTTNTCDITGLNDIENKFIRITAENSYGMSLPSEILAYTNYYSSISNFLAETNILIVNGFDRASDGNTYDFATIHSYFIGKTLASCTNEALTDGLFNMNDYKMVDYILGEESTADETFSAAEQLLVAEYLEQGGYLFVSGSEIAWDLDYKGSSSDKIFFHNYLKAAYADDAPAGTAGTYYNVKTVTGSLFNYNTDFSFDDGTNGTYDVNYPDVLTPVQGGIAALNYTGVSEPNCAGVFYEGTFGESSDTGKVVCFGFPYETITTYDARSRIMFAIKVFFDLEIQVDVEDESVIPMQYSLNQNYPNPFNPTTKISFTLQESGITKLEVFNSLGEKLGIITNEYLSAGTHTFNFNAANLASGIYFYRLTSGSFVETKKMTLLK